MPKKVHFQGKLGDCFLIWTVQNVMVAMGHNIIKCYGQQNISQILFVIKYVDLI